MTPLVSAGSTSTSQASTQPMHHAARVIIPATVVQRQAQHILGNDNTGQALLKCSLSSRDLLQKLMLAGIVPESTLDESTRPIAPQSDSLIDIYLSTDSSGDHAVAIGECIQIPHERSRDGWIVFVDPDASRPLHALIAAQFAADAVISASVAPMSPCEKSVCTLKSDAPPAMAINQRVFIVFTPRCGPVEVLSLIHI